MNRDEARKYFKSKNLTYDDITSGDICVLAMVLNKSIKVANKNNEMSVNTMHMSEKIKSKYKSNGKLVECYFFINSHYFTRRECISFNKDGFIGFCGWADGSNTAPVIKAFIKWCDYLAKSEDDKNETNFI
ncbi:hypothetical protein [uncultured Clostridium sp.]|uniref:hypothetical protein n=1 Tax=uncultured Clostridium sp. TaxID=59620 RepID=UPI0028EB642B|nr:hypothetical protein [uncultured Clostridium sp.]